MSNKESSLKRSKVFYQANRERLIKMQIEKYNNNKEKYQEYGRNYYYENINRIKPKDKQKLQEYNRQYYLQNKNKFKRKSEQINNINVCEGKFIIEF